MARQAKTTKLDTAAIETPPAAVMHDHAQSAEIGTIVQGLSEDRDLVNQLLGQAQMAGAFEEFSRTVRTSKLAFIKENKLYRALAGKKTPNGSESLRGTWDEFCILLGLSSDKADLDIANLRAFGEDALESMSRMGIGYRELRQYRRLPDDQKTALIEVAKSGDKESFVELAEEIIAKHAKEKESAQAELDAKAALLAKEKQHSERLAKDNDDLHTKLSRVKTAKPDQVLKDIRQELSGFCLDIESILATKVQPAVEALYKHCDAHGLVADELINGPLGELETQVREIRQAFVGASADDVAPWAKS